jgi:hypothetical protein
MSKSCRSLSGTLRRSAGVLRVLVHVLPVQDHISANQTTKSEPISVGDDAPVLASLLPMAVHHQIPASPFVPLCSKKIHLVLSLTDTSCRQEDSMDDTPHIFTRRLATYQLLVSCS